MRRIFTLLLLSLPVLVGAQASLTNNLVAHYRFSNDFNANGVGANLNTSMTNLPTFTEDKWGNANSALRFDPTVDISGFGIENNAFCGGQFSVSMNIKVNGSHYMYNYSSVPFLFVRNSYSSYFERATIAIRPDGKLAAQSSDGLNLFNSFSTTSTNDWVHAVMVYNAGTITLYVNGVAMSSATPSSTVCASSFASLGHLAFGSHHARLNGDMDEIRVYNTALTAERVERIYTADFLNDGFIPVPDVTEVHFPFTNGSFYDEIDSVEIVNNTGVSFVTDRHGDANSALFLDGTQMKTLSFINGIACETGVTMSLYFKRTANSSFTGLSFMPLLATRNTSNSYFERWALGMTSSHIPNLFSAYSGATNHTENPNNLADTENWHHMVGVYAADSNKIYIDGQLVSTVPNVFPDMTCGEEYRIYVGCLGSNTNSRFMGALDDIRIFNSVLTDQEIADLNDLPTNPGNGNNVSVKTDAFNNFKIYPNPAKESFVLSGDDLQLYSHVEVIDLLGVVVSQHRIDGSAITISTSNLTEGIYFARILGATGKTVKFQVVK